MELNELLDKPLPGIPDDIRRALEENKITATSFEEKDRILEEQSLQQEIGYKKMEDGSYLVSMNCPMEGITSEMIEWWFWWHCQEDIRYQVWYPKDHISIHYHKKDREYFEQALQPPFQPNSQCPVEKIGGVSMPLRIDFETPEQFGFSRKVMEEQNIPVIVCGKVSAFNGLIKHTEMAHIYKQTENGLFMVSRFWLGKTLKNRFLHKLIITDEMAKGMAEHCCIEYRNLCEILPGLYEQYKTPK